MDAGNDQRGDQGTDANLPEISTSQAAERRIFGTGHDYAVSEVPVPAGATGEGWVPDRSPNWKLSAGTSFEGPISTAPRGRRQSSTAWRGSIRNQRRGRLRV